MASLKEFLGSTGLGALWARITEELNKKATSADLADVATSGSYNDLEDKPFIPSAVSDLTDDSGHYTKPVTGIPASDLEETYLTSFTETDPTVPSWAKEAEKPTYTATEVGAMATDHPANNITAGNIENWIKQTNLLSVDSDHNNAYDYWWTLTIPRNALWNINNAPGSSGNLKYLYVPSTNENKLIRLELPTSNGKLALISDTPAWARATNKPTYTAQEVGALPADTVIPTVPTNVSAFTNDVGYLTQHQDISGKADKSEIPTSVSELTNDAGYITGYTETDPTVPAWAKASTKPSYTAAEVGAPTVAEMNSAIGDAIGNVHQFEVEIVQELPVENIKEHTVYFVPKSGATNDIYDEYIYTNNAWEMIGNTQIDLSNYVQKDQIATGNNAGLVKVNPNYGIKIEDNTIKVVQPQDAQIVAGLGTYTFITAAKQHMSAFFGLAKAAGDTTQMQSNNPVGTYTDGAKTAIRTMLGVATPADIPTNVSAFTNDAGYLTQHQSLDNYVQKTDYATSDSYGLVKIGNGLRIYSETGLLSVNPSFSEPEVKRGTNGTKPIVPGSQHYSTFYGLSKAAGVDLANETVTFGTYPETSKTAIRSLIGAAAASDIPSVPVQDVQINGTSILSSGIANVPIMSASAAGVAKVAPYYGLDIITAGNSIDTIRVYGALNTDIKTGTNAYRPIVPNTQHTSTFYGLAKAAGADMASSNNEVGTYTETAKTAIRSMIGATSSNIVAVQDTQPVEADAKIWMMETAPESVQVPTMEDMADYVQKTDIATDTTAGIVKVIAGNGISISGSTNALIIAHATSAQMKNGVNQYNPITADGQHYAVYYGLSKVAGVDLASETVTVGTYPETSKTAIRNMLGAVGDVQINGTSITSSGVANIPIASPTAFGVVKTDANSFGIKINEEGRLYTVTPGPAEMKAGTQAYKPIVPATQHTSVFYGLAKAAGDTTMASSSNTVGTYTDEAKAAIHTMLGIDSASIAAQVDIPLVETVSGTTPTITGQPNVRYVCDEVSTITITPPASGSVDVIFESGSIATVMTVPSTVKWPAWFDAETLEANTTYEILITDGIYGSVMTWAT